MSLTDGSGLSAADVAAVVGSNGSNGFGWGNDGGWWLILLFLFAFAGNGFGGYGGFGGGGGAIPYMMSNNAQADVQRGFDQSAIMNGLNGLTTSISNGFANAEVSRCNSQANVLQTLNANQNATTNALNSIGMSLQNCCCENRAGLADVKYAIATENCADRAAVSDGIRDILAATQAQTQTILDKICQQEIDALKAQNANLQTQLNMANLSASQTAQTARLLSDNAAQTAALEQYLNPTPVPAYVVQNPNGCGCGYYNGCGYTM